ncbi:DUF86 domain-containing protein [bacterium]|nr:DUF86 domain-containing protein [bacterium]
MTSIQHHRDIISFRNILIHGYDAVDDRIVWGIVQEELHTLVQDVEQLLQQETPDNGSSHP